jgi:hypothetical protein
MLHFCIQRLHWTPRQYLELSEKERAFVVASIRLRIEAEEKELKKAKRAH